MNLDLVLNQTKLHILKEISETKGVVNIKNQFQNHTENYIKPKKIRIKIGTKVPLIIQDLDNIGVNCKPPLMEASRISIVHTQHTLPMGGTWNGSARGNLTTPLTRSLISQMLQLTTGGNIQIFYPSLEQYFNMSKLSNGYTPMIFQCGQDASCFALSSNYRFLFVPFILKGFFLGPLYLSLLWNLLVTSAPFSVFWRRIVADCHKNDLAFIGDLVIEKSSKMKKIGEKLAYNCIQIVARVFLSRKGFFPKIGNFFLTQQGFHNKIFLSEMLGQNLAAIHDKRTAFDRYKKQPWQCQLWAIYLVGWFFQCEVLTERLCNLLSFEIPQS